MPFIRLFCAQKETRTLKEITPTASETATFTNFATWAGEPDDAGNLHFGAQNEIRTRTPFQAPPPQSGASTNFATWA